jgi:hypothetical protein
VNIVPQIQSKGSKVNQESKDHQVIEAQQDQPDRLEQQEPPDVQYRKQEMTQI